MTTIKHIVQILNVTALTAIFILTFGCNSNNQQDDFINESFKKQLSSGEIDKKEIVIDSTNRIYSNYKYGIAFKETRGWSLDYGVGQYTILRAYQNDSAISFSINVIETDLSKDIDMHQVIELNGVEKYTEQLRKDLSRGYTDIFDMKVEKTYFKNMPASKVTFKYKYRSENETYIMNLLMYQFVKGKNIISCGINSLDLLFQRNQNPFDPVFDNDSILYN
jgi:hypothetical protein